MCRAATDHVIDQGRSKEVGHRGADGSLPHDRLQRYGRLERSGEAIAYGNRQGNSTVLQLMVDDGVAGRGHRKLILTRDFRYVGVDIGPHPVFSEMCDILFADYFSDR